MFSQLRTLLSRMGMSLVPGRRWSLLPADNPARCTRMHVSVLFAFAAALAVLVAVPGPGVFAVVSCALGRGVRPALGLVVGVVLGDLVYFTCAVLGMAALAREMGASFLVVKWAGAAYLVWLGFLLWRARPAAVASANAGTGEPRGFGRSMLGGLAVTLGNPKAIAFYAGLLPTFVDLERVSLGEGVVMSVIVVVIVGGIMAAYALAAAAGRRFMARPGRVRVMNRVAGTMMIGAAVIMVVR